MNEELRHSGWRSVGRYFFQFPLCTLLLFLLPCTSGRRLCREQTCPNRGTSSFGNLLLCMGDKILCHT